MDPSPTSQKERKKKGLGRLWTKIKLALGLKKKPQTTDTVSAVSKPSGTLQTSTTESPPKERTQQPQSLPTTEPTPTPEPASVTTRVPEPQTISSVPPAMEPAELPATQPSQENTDKEQSAAEPMTQTIPVVVVHGNEKDELYRRYERAQAIFKKYNLEFDDSDEWNLHPRAPVERVQKLPRMRVRWTCHECKTTFGHEKVCYECAHQRCRNCVRYPPKKKKARVAKKAAAAATTDMAGSEPMQEDAQEGACHECQTTFELGSQECPNCHHRICDRCLQETISSIPQEEIRTSHTA